MKGQPKFIVEDLDNDDIKAISVGGCASGAYMPAVTYHQALVTMSEHGDDVFDFIEECLGEVPFPKEAESWSGLAVFYLSLAVELYVDRVIADSE